VDALGRYLRELQAWNQVHNLTAIQAPEQIRIKHFLDSLSCALAMRSTPVNRIVDVGTGAGFPGLVLKILYPAAQLTLVESVSKKAAFCEHVAASLELSNVTVLKLRVEEVGHLAAHREQHDWVVARAVAVMPALAEYLLPLARIGGRILAMKGEAAPAEVHAAEHAFRILGGHLRQLLPVSLPGVAEQRYLVVVDKVAATPGNYPRRVGVPARRPLLKPGEKLPTVDQEPA
jgi:16S rRNA (guanine527-N7)-methyltransferase